MLAGADEEGQPILKPFEHTATAEQGKNEIKRARS
jgi:hypothetical protein